MVPHLPDGPTVGLAQNYRDAMTLLAEARDYAAAGVAEDCRELQPFDRLRVSTRSMQMTACLAGIIAWLMSQRAVEVGEIAREESHLSEHRLAECPLCAPAADEAVQLPSRLELLIRRTLQLYRRLERLDRLLEGAPA